MEEEAATKLHGIAIQNGNKKPGPAASACPARYPHVSETPPRWPVNSLQILRHRQKRPYWMPIDGGLSFSRAAMELSLELAACAAHQPGTREAHTFSPSLPYYGLDQSA